MNERLKTLIISHTTILLSCTMMKLEFVQKKIWISDRFPHLNKKTNHKKLEFNFKWKGQGRLALKQIQKSGSALSHILIFTTSRNLYILILPHKKATDLEFIWIISHVQQSEIYSVRLFGHLPRIFFYICTYILKTEVKRKEIAHAFIGFGDFK